MAGLPALLRPTYSEIGPRVQEEALLRLLALSGLLVLGVVAVGCSASGAASIEDDLSPTAIPATAVVPPPPTQPPPSPTVDPARALTGFSFPLAGACLPQGDQLMPNAPRPYRKGIHEGVDFYQVDNCTAITKGTEVLAAKPGRVVRADLDFNDMTRDELARNLADPNTDAALDAFRGRQVWVEHEGGIVTRYAHLSGIAPGIGVGTEVTRGQLIAFVGESGTPESITNPGHEYHLHFEVRVGASFLGKDLPAKEVRARFTALFAPLP